MPLNVGWMGGTIIDGGPTRPTDALGDSTEVRVIVCPLVATPAAFQTHATGRISGSTDDQNRSVLGAATRACLGFFHSPTLQWIGRDRPARLS